MKVIGQTYKRLVEAGRILSKANESKLRSALQELQKVLSLLDEDGDSEEAKKAKEALREAANAGEWLESRIHLMFTEIADGMFGEGRLTRDERITLSSAIGAALDAFRGEIEAGATQLYQRAPWKEPEPMAAVSEAGELASMFVPLLEKAVRRDGTIPLKIIQPGWGSSGYYPASVLERDGPQVFRAGTQMFWDHPTAAEEAERPEGSLQNLAAVLVSDARWNNNGPAGPGLYADARVFEGYQNHVNELAPHIGVSIRASGRAIQGEAEGRRGPIIQEIALAKGIDFVTKPGAGGQILQMFEAARQQHVQSTTQPTKERSMSEELTRQLQEAQQRLAQLEQQNGRLTEALLLQEARQYVVGALATVTLPDVTKNRLTESLCVNPPVKDSQLDKATYASRIEEAIKAEVDYLAEVGAGSGHIVGMGNSQVAKSEYKHEEVQARMAESFQRLGLNEAAAKDAAKGRGW